MFILGVDLGTSNTLVARIGSAGKPEIVQIDGDTMIPSVICIEEEGGNPTFGYAALDMWESGYDTDKTFKRWKLKIGEECVISRIKTGSKGTEEYVVTPEELTKLMIEYVIRTVSHGDDGMPVESILVTVPHGWRRESPEKCRATRIASAMAKVEGKPVTVQEITVSEPVAAAAYWLWITRQNSSPEDFVGKTLLVCDVGGGTFDLSLVEVGPVEKPLDVIAAGNNEYAGDYIDALLCAYVCGQFNRHCGTDYPMKADGVLEKILTGEITSLRQWFMTCKGMKEKLSERISQVLLRKKPLENVKQLSQSFDDPLSNKHLQITLGPKEFLDLIEPFYEHGKELLNTFLNKIPRDKFPYAVVFAGGGSRVYGVREHVVMPVLEKLAGPGASDKILTRIVPNKGNMDQAIALGAALIANGIVSVQERLLHDVGIILEASEIYARALNLPNDGKQFILTPLLAKGSLLPAVVNSNDFGLPAMIAAGETLEIKIVIDDESHDPWIQTWEVAHPVWGKEAYITWIAEADADGALTLHFFSEKGQNITLQGRLERNKTGKASIVIGYLSDQKYDGLPRVYPDKLKEAHEKIWGTK